MFPLVATRPPAAPWVRPPLRSLRWMESFLDTLHRCGFTDAGCVGAYRAFSSFLLGHLLLEVSAQGADIGPIEQADPDDKPRTDLSQYPRLKSLETNCPKTIRPTNSKRPWKPCSTASTCSTTTASDDTRTNR